MDLEKKLNEILKMTEPAIDELGYKIYHLENVTEEGEQYLRYYIENKNGDDITLDDCEKVSRKVSDILDEKDPIDEQYFLEVSSPGLFKPLFNAEHIKAEIGERVEVKLNSDDKSKNRFTGELRSFENGILVIETERGQKEIEYKKIKSINLDPEV
ncbi:MAG: ribosome maturation factor RimP [Clostridiaceae bacterium]